MSAIDDEQHDQKKPLDSGAAEAATGSDATGSAEQAEVADPARSLFEGWGLRPGRTAYGWTVADVALDRFTTTALIDFERDATRFRVRARRASDAPSFARIGAIEIFHDKLDDESLSDPVAEVLTLVAEWLRQRADVDALGELLAGVEAERQSTGDDPVGDAQPGDASQPDSSERTAATDEPDAKS
jgi:hypothetical protein